MNENRTTEPRRNPMALNNRRVVTNILSVKERDKVALIFSVLQEYATDFALPDLNDDELFTIAVAAFLAGRGRETDLRRSIVRARPRGA